MPFVHSEEKNLEELVEETLKSLSLPSSWKISIIGLGSVYADEVRARGELGVGAQIFDELYRIPEVGRINLVNRDVEKANLLAQKSKSVRKDGKIVQSYPF